MKKSHWFIEGLRRFVRNERGLVTVEWVALTGGMVVAAVAISFIVMKNTATASASIGGGISGEVTSTYGAHGANLQ